ncbi:halocin C8-like domain-containing protein [Thermococcus sp.]|uniref:halocin C8-like domain-containing protein n=1 Tax=Thermococcus sp. TaxID=35749 RepID=UPI002610D07B|nr:halocin C8-like domain-containing protein [Thermococcus sp.]
MNWRKTAFGVFLVAMVLSLQLIVAPQAMAMSTNNASITFRRAVVAWYDDRGRLQMNVTWVNKVVNFTNLTKGCPLHKSNVTPKVNVSIVTLYNMSEKHEQLLFFRLNFYNSTFNYTMYALVYRAERSQYNFTLVTRIFTDLKTGEYRAYLTGMNIAPDDKNKAVPVGDVILIANNLTLSQYYWTLNRVLMKLRRGDETRWIWDRSAYELRHLSHLVRLKLPEYNQEKAVGMTATMDLNIGCSACVALAGYLCGVLASGVSGYVACTEACGEFCVVFIEAGGIGYFICLGTCEVTCNALLRIIVGAGTYTACALGGYYICEKAGLC